MLDLGEVRYFAKIYVNGKRIGEKTMPPYRYMIGGLKAGDEISVCVANTIANVCHNAELFKTVPIEDIGKYHEKMAEYEKNTAAGGIIGPVRLYAIKH